MCAEPGCPELTTVGRCPAHQRARQNAQRRGSIRRNYGPDWERISRRVRRARPTCECADPACGVCAGQCTNPSEHVDHITPLEYFTDLRAAHDPTTPSIAKGAPLTSRAHPNR